MPNRLLADWYRLRGNLRDGVDLSQPKRLADIEQFRQALVDVCGEEPTVLMNLDPPVRCLDDLVEVSLADYFGWLLRARHGAVYQWWQGSYRCLAAFGTHPRQVSQGGVLAQWLLDNGLLIRSKLTLAGLTAEESETLLRELDLLEAHLVAPIVFNDTLWGFFIAGPPIIGEYNGSEGLYLSLYGVSIMNCLTRRQQGLPSRQEAKRMEEDEALEEVLKLWVALRPRKGRIPLLVVDEEPDAVKALTSFFNRWGLEVAGATSEEEALEILKRTHPQIILVDFSLKRSFPKKLLEAARDFVPEAILLGTTAAHNDTWDKFALSLRVQRIFRKPCRLARMAKAVFEAALDVCVLRDSASYHRTGRCLIVDDEQEGANAFQEYLEARGFQVWSAATGEQALELSSQLRPHLILLDLKLPGIQGTDLLCKIRQITPQSKIVVLTGWVCQYPEQALKSLRPDAYCTKPASVEELNQLIDDLLIPVKGMDGSIHLYGTEPVSS